MYCSSCFKHTPYGALVARDVKAVAVEPFIVKFTATLYRTCKSCGGSLSRAKLEVISPFGHNCSETSAVNPGCHIGFGVLEVWGVPFQEPLVFRRDGKTLLRQSSVIHQLYGVDFTAKVQCTQCDVLLEVHDRVGVRLKDFKPVYVNSR